MFNPARIVPLLIVLVIKIINNTAFAIDLSNIMYAIEHGDPTLSFRIRQEVAKQEKLSTASASTLKSQLGYQSGEFYNTNFLLEMVNVSNFLGQKYNKYNTNTTKVRNPGYTIINDPKSSGVTKANLTSEYFPCNEIIIGRQSISLDNSRMIGSNDFRQFPTIFDAISIKNNFLDDFDIFFSYITNTNANSIASNNLATDEIRSLRTMLLNVMWQNFIYGKTNGYFYNNHDLTISNNSNVTMGGRIISDEIFNKVFKFDYEVELAKQKSNKHNRNKYSTIYFHLAFSKDSEKLFKNLLITTKLGYELLDSHSNIQPGHAFNFSLGNPHGFNGLAETFAINPLRGLKDYYFKFTAEYYNWLDVMAELHIFKYAKGSNDRFIGVETDLKYIFKITKDLTSELIFAKLNAKNQLKSTNRFSMSIDYHPL